MNENQFYTQIYEWGRKLEESKFNSLQKPGITFM